MKVRTSLVAMASMALLASATFIGCTTEDEPGGGTDNRSKLISGTTDVTMDITGLSLNQMYTVSVGGSSSDTKITGITAIDATTLRVKWTRGIGDVGADTVYYQADGAATSKTLTWATAIKKSAIRLYETADSDPTHPSGLILDGDNTRAVSVTGAEASNVDLVFQTDPSAPNLPFAIVAAGYYYSNGMDTTLINNTSYVVDGGAGSDFYTTSVDNSTYFNTTTPNTFSDIPETISTSNTSLIVLVKTEDNHFARIEVLPNSTTGRLWGDTANNKRFIDINVFYQPQAGWGYM